MLRFSQISVNIFYGTPTLQNIPPWWLYLRTEGDGDLDLHLDLDPSLAFKIKLTISVNRAFLYLSPNLLACSSDLGSLSLKITLRSLLQIKVSYKYWILNTVVKHRDIKHYMILLHYFYQHLYGACILYVVKQLIIISQNRIRKPNGFFLIFYKIVHKINTGRHTASISLTYTSNMTSFIGGM